ncbi:divalent metal cation transporter [Patescibacteria group bacterium]|nr:divalent metal cation transporter [Patescibacteria group bacterium]
MNAAGGSLGAQTLWYRAYRRGHPAIPILASSSAYAIAQLFSWPQGLDRKPKRAKGFYAVITAGFLVCLAALISNLNPIKIIFYSQVLVGILTVLLIYFILRIAGSKKIMGSWRCGFWSRLAGWLAIAILLAGCVLFIYFLFK